MRLALARLKVLIVARNERLRIGRDVGLRLAPAERCFDEWLAVVLAVFEMLFRARLELLVVAATALGTRSLEVRVALPELLLRDCDQAEIMLGMLKVVLRRDRIAGRLRVARELKIFFGDMAGRAADLHVGAIGFVNPCERVMIAAIIIIAIAVIVVVAPAHALVVVVLMLTVSHGLLFIHSGLRRLWPAGSYPSSIRRFAPAEKIPLCPQPKLGPD